MRFSLRISAFSFLFAVLLAAIGCGGGSVSAQKASTSQQKAPIITFSAQPGTVASGASTVLSWTASNASSVSVSGVGTFPATSSVKVTPTATTTYTATAAGPGGSTLSSTVVSVTTTGQAPTVALSAQPSTIVSGTSAVLSWTTTNATSVSIAGVGTFGATGSTNVTPTSTTTYTATATGPGGTAGSNATVTVTPVQTPPPTISLSAQPNTIPSGGTSILSWTTTNATSVNIPGLGSFPPQGSTNVKPSVTTTYTATAQGAGGTAPASATVTVKGTALSKLQASGGWKSWGELPPGYGICNYPCPGVTWSMQQGTKSPSLSGDATQFNIGGTTPYADVLWSNPLIGANSTQGLPDSGHTLLPTLHNFTYDAYFYPTNVGVTQVIEFDISMYFNGLSLIWGNQCNILGGHEWDIWDNVGQKWVSAGVACNPVNNAWNHLTIQVQRESDNSLLFQSITLNGVTNNINRKYPPGSAPGSWWGITVNYQMDGNDQMASSTTFLDNFTFIYW
jgi:hypothetical protein